MYIGRVPYLNFQNICKIQFVIVVTANRNYFIVVLVEILFIILGTRIKIQMYHLPYNLITPSIQV
jgi:hypothetical protein